MIERTFQDIPEGKIQYADNQSFLINLGWSRGETWNDLLQSKRILLISEAGAGKTYECRSQKNRLWADGEPAFFVELAALATDDLSDLLDADEESRLDVWLSSQSDVATFFLDSVDELKLTLGSFERALKRFKKNIGSQLHRAKIIITSRPIPFDGQLFRNILPVPAVPSSELSEETFANIAMRDHQNQRNNRDLKSKSEWRSVALMPLSDKQIIEFSRGQGLDDPDVLLEDLQSRNAQEFARRPQDLIELCADWREHKRIRKHRDQVATNVRVKLLPRDDRLEPAELSVDKAMEGAGRLALAGQVMRRRTIRHSAASDDIHDEAALDPAIILSDWQPKERKALLERPLFVFASYGRVRIHLSVAEYLAAERLFILRKQGMSFRSLKRLLFAQTKGNTIVRPSKRPIAAWLALQENRVFETLRDNDPAVLLVDGDPESLTQKQRNQALHAFSDRYGVGGWRGLSVPNIQVHRFASNEIGEEIRRIWSKGVENPEIRVFLINCIEYGRIVSCADIVFNVASDKNSAINERMSALDALVAIDDRRLRDLSARIALSDDRWPDQAARGAIIRLFPKYMSVEQFCQVLGWLKQETRTAGDMNWRLPRLIATSNLGYPDLEEIRDRLVLLVSDGLKWQKTLPHITSNRPNLSGALAATCVCGLETSQNDNWLHAGLLALRLHHEEDKHDEPFNSLRDRLIKLDAKNNSRLFWVADALIQSLHEVKGPFERYIEIAVFDEPVQLRPDRDLIWVNEALSDTRRALEERAMLLEASLRLSPDGISRKEHAEGLRSFVSDAPSLAHKIDDWLKTSRYDQEQQRFEKKQAERKARKKQENDAAHKSWVKFWREVANYPEQAFSSQQSFKTAYNLWRAMRHVGDDSRSSGWNRRFIEEQFNKETANRLRQALMKLWRNDNPTLPSERPKDERNSYLVKWQLGLAAIYAEAEDPKWATKLTHTEAKLVSKYALIELNGLPQWMEALIDAHPTAVDQTLGEELSWDLGLPPETHGQSILLQSIGYASKKVAKLFLPRLESWLLNGEHQTSEAEEELKMIERVRQVIGVILKHGDAEAIEKLRTLALQRTRQQLPSALRLVWASPLIRVDPSNGVEVLKEHLTKIEPKKLSEATTWFASLFGNRDNAIGLADERFSPQLLLQLLRLAYQHVQIKDDAQHEGSYSPDVRDDAEQARNNILTALLDAKGEEGLAAKLELAADPLCAHLKDRILFIAEENLAQEIDADRFDETQAVALDKNFEAPASTNEAMFAIMMDRLSDIDDLLLSDVSPREAWAGISEEKLMRREIARELLNSANSLYTVDQESVTADEKETDIRLRSVASHHEAVIELKLGDRRTAHDLYNTIETQLVNKYMMSEHSRAGVLLVTLNKNRKWNHPDGDRTIDVDELFALLREEAIRVREALGGTVAIGIHFLDLRPRLTTEKQAKFQYDNHHSK